MQNQIILALNLHYIIPNFTLIANWLGASARAIT